MDNNTLLQTIRTQGEQAQLMVEQTKALEQIIEEMTNLKNERNKMNDITFNLYCTSVEDAINAIEELKEAHPNDKLQFDVNIQDGL